jgi:hypothetical protein
LFDTPLTPLAEGNGSDVTFKAFVQSVHNKNYHQTIPGVYSFKNPPKTV